MFRDDRPCPICPDDRALDPPPGFETRLRCGGCRERGLGEKIKGWLTSFDPTRPRRPKDES